MVSINTVFIGGHLGADPEDRRTASGKLMASFRLATNRWDSHKESEITEWYSIVCWEKQAEHCLKYLRKGSAVLVEGRLTERQWDGPDGKRNFKTEIIASRVSFLGSPRGAGPAPSATPVEVTVEAVPVALPAPGEAPVRQRQERRARRDPGAYGDEAIPF